MIDMSHFTPIKPKAMLIVHALCPETNPNPDQLINEKKVITSPITNL